MFPSSRFRPDNPHQPVGEARVQVDLQKNFDYVITVCDNANESCPVYPGHTNRIQRSFEDPAADRGSEEERLSSFRRVRDQIRSWLNEFAREPL